MKQVLFKSILIFLFVVLVLTQTQEKSHEQLLEELNKAQQELQKAQQNIESFKSPKDEDEKKTQKLSKQEKEALKTQERERKQLEKEKKTIEKQSKKQQRLEDENKRQQEKQIIDEQKEIEQQKILSDHQKCAGAFTLENGECGTCSENCEQCSSPQSCDFCQPGFFRVIENNKKNNKSHCATSVPTGYLPQLKNFKKNNPQVQQTQENYKFDALFLDGKKTVTKEVQGLPYTLNSSGQPVVNGNLVRVDVVPCKTHCSVCAGGFISVPQTRGCIQQENCTFPQELVQQNGQLVCNENDPQVWKGQINTIQKQKQQQNQSVPVKKSLTLQALTNQENNISLSYEWSIFDSQQQDITSTVLPKGNLGEKIKINISAFVQGQLYHINCLVKDAKTNQSLELKTQYTLPVQETQQKVEL